MGIPIVSLVIGSPSMAPHPRADGLRWTAVFQLFVAVLVVASFAMPQRLEAAAHQAPEVRVPQSTEDHLELAAMYERLATQHRERAANLRKSLETELRRLAVPPNKSGSEFPWVTKVRRQMHSKIATAEQTATDALRAAEYHRLRAKEVEGLEFSKLVAEVERVPR